MNKKNYLFFLFSFFFSCVNKSDPTIVRDTDQCVEIKLDEKTPELSIDTFIDSVYFVTLETTERSMFGSASQLYFMDSLILIVDQEQTKSILIFDKNGKFKTKIGRTGRGPDEYIDFSYVGFTPDKEELYVVDNRTSKIHFYRVDGTFIRNEPLPYDSHNVEFLEDGAMACYNMFHIENRNGYNTDNTLALLNRDGNDLYKAFPTVYEGDRFYFLNNFALSKYEDKLYFTPSCCDTIFQVMKDRLIARYIVNIDSGRRPKINESTEHQEYIADLFKYECFVGKFIELENTIFFEKASSQFPYVIYSKTENKTYTCNDKSTNPLYSFIKQTYGYARYGQNTLAIVVPPIKILTYRDKEKKICESNPQMRQLLSQITEESNPVIFFYDIKLNNDNN